MTRRAAFAMLAAMVACLSSCTKSGEDAGDTPSGGVVPVSTAASTSVTLSEAAFATAKIEVAKVEADASSIGGAIEMTGQVEFDSTRIAAISPRAAGRIERLLFGPGDRVVEGQPVAYLSSPQLLTAQSDFLQATRRAALLDGTPDAAGATALAAAARRRLLLLGATEEAIARLASGGEPSLSLPVASPISGSILEVLVLTGTVAEAGTPLFRVADLSVVNVVADVPERALAVIHPGVGAAIRVAAYPAVEFAGRVSRTKDELDPSTRTAKVVIRVANSERRLKPGMFASVRLRTSTAGMSLSGEAERRLLSVPETAVVTDGEMRYVFVQSGPRTFERRTIEVIPPESGVSTPGRVVVRSDLLPGEQVVVRGAFVLKSELAKSAFGEKEG